MLIGQAFKPGGNLLLGLHQDVQQVFGYVAVFVVKERRGQTLTKQKSDYKITTLAYAEVEPLKTSTKAAQLYKNHFS